VAKRALVTLTTDFGLADPYVAAMKGAILSQCPLAELIDISHEIPPHQILSGAFVLAEAAPFFPPGTVHVVVVDPGVGTDRSVLVGLFAGQTYVFPDNGVITLIQERFTLEGLVVVRNLRLLSAGGASATFHGRDLFAPLVGYVLNGNPIRKLGPTPERYTLLKLPRPFGQGEDLLGRVLHVDRFGNLITNITRTHLQKRFSKLDALNVSCQGRPVSPLRTTYGQVEPGRPLALINSMDLLELAVNQGRFCDVFQAAIGAEVAVRQQQFIEGTDET